MHRSVASTALGAVCLGLTMAGRLAAATVIGFETFSLPPDSFYNGSDFAGDFTLQGVTFGNAFDDTFGAFWSGFAVSNVMDPSTPGFDNQYASASGAGLGGGGNYGVAFDDAFGPEKDIITLASPGTVRGLYVNNTTYTALSMRDGDGFAKAFGGVDGTDPDFFRLTITGRDAGGGVLGAVDTFLADYRFSDPAEDYILTDWSWVDLSGLGNEVASLHFGLASSDTGAFGMNTPAYFVVDGVTVVPEPGAGALVLAGLTGLYRMRRVRR